MKMFKQINDIVKNDQTLRNKKNHGAFLKNNFIRTLRNKNIQLK